jgi:tetratricopeptide (TPR) repeat protein
MFLAELAEPYWAAAVRAYGPTVLGDSGPDDAGAAAFGRDLLRAVYGARASSPAELAALTARPDDEAARSAFLDELNITVDDDEALSEHVAALLERRFAAEIAAARPGARRDLAELHKERGDASVARVLLEDAIAAGDDRARLDLARLIVGHLVRDRDGAVVVLERAAGVPDADVAAEALVWLGRLHSMPPGSPGRAEAAYRRAVDIGRSPWVVEARLGLGWLWLRSGRLDAARVAFDQVAATAAAADAGHAWTVLAGLLREQGDRRAAASACRRAVELGGDAAAEAAELLTELETGA